MSLKALHFNIQISQGSAETDARQGGRIYSDLFCRSPEWWKHHLNRSTIRKYWLASRSIVRFISWSCRNIPATSGNKPHYWSMMPVTICFVIPLIEMDTELEAIVNQVIKFKISTTQ